MNAALHQDCEDFGRDLFDLYEQALRLRRMHVAEHLLSALEALAESEEDCEVLRDRAYLGAVQCRRHDA